MIVWCIILINGNLCVKHYELLVERYNHKARCKMKIVDSVKFGRKRYLISKLTVKKLSGFVLDKGDACAF